MRMPPFRLSRRLTRNYIIYMVQGSSSRMLLGFWFPGTSWLVCGYASQASASRRAPLAPTGFSSRRSLEMSRLVKKISFLTGCHACNLRSAPVEMATLGHCLEGSRGKQREAEGSPALSSPGDPNVFGHFSDCFSLPLQASRRPGQQCSSGRGQALEQLGTVKPCLDEHTPLPVGIRARMGNTDSRTTMILEDGWGPAGVGIGRGVR